MNIELLQQLCEASAVSGDEQEVRSILIGALEPASDEITFDGLGSFVARKGTAGRKSPSSAIWMKWALWSRISTSGFSASPPLAVGGASRC
jgi:hypothetical protein